jgi:hypothetical protein
MEILVEAIVDRRVAEALKRHEKKFAHEETGLEE